jgi:hypothetical protein
MRNVLAVVVLAGCTDTTIVVRPVIDVPVNEEAQARDLITLTMSVAHAGVAADITSATFNPGDEIALGNVPFGDDLVIHMVGRFRNASSNDIYGRTCAFAVRPDEPPPAPHLFLSHTFRHGHMTQQPLNRFGGIAVTNQDGSAVLLGGAFPDEAGTNQPLTQIERFDPNNGLYDTLHEIERRLDPAIAIAGIGTGSRIVVLGGLDPMTNRGSEYLEVIDAQRFTDLQYERFTNGSLNRTGLSATTLSDGRVVVIGGLTPADGAVPAQPSNAVYQLTVARGTANVVPFGRATLTHARYDHSATRMTESLGAPVLVAGGRNALGEPIKEAELFRPLAESFSANFTATMIVPRWNHRAISLPDGSVLFIGGLTKDAMNRTVDVSTIELFSPFDGRFIAIGSLDNQGVPPVGRVGLSATTLPNGEFLITGGRRLVSEDMNGNLMFGDSTNEAAIGRVDPTDGTVRILQAHKLKITRSDHQATVLCDGTVLISGGTLGPSTFERYNPAIDDRR